MEAVKRAGSDMRGKGVITQNGLAVAAAKLLNDEDEEKPVRRNVSIGTMYQFISMLDKRKKAELGITLQCKVKRKG